MADVIERIGLWSGKDADGNKYLLYPITSLDCVDGADTLLDFGNAQTLTDAQIAQALANLGITATAAELNYVDGVTSSIQTQLNAKAASSHNHAASAITSGTLSSNRLPTVPVSKGGTGATTAATALSNLGLTATAAELNKMDGVTATTAEINYVDGVTSNIQTQLNGKAPTSHASTEATYGIGTGSNFGHVKLSDATDDTSAASDGKAASPKAVKAAYDLANTAKTNAATAQSTANTAKNNAATAQSRADAASTAAAEAQSAAEAAQATADGKADASHTHNYAGSSSAGGAATSANKLNTNAGSATQPVYFANGVPVATTYTLGKSVPSNAVFTDTNTHYTSKNVVGATDATSNTGTALTNGNVYLNSVENGAVTSSHKISGSGATTVTTDASGNIVISSTDNNTTYGVVSTTANGLAPKRDGSTTKFLRGDGTWAVPPDTNTVYTHPTTSGNKHIPAGGSSGQILRWSADGTAVWGADNNTTYSAMTGATSSAAGNAGLVPAPAAGAQASFLRGDGTWAVPVTVDSALSSTSTNPVQNKAVYSALNGKAASSHNHSASNITSGTLAVARGGTGVTSNPSMLTNLGSTSAASVFAASPRPGVTGTLPIANGGTGATTVEGILSALGISEFTTAEIDAAFED